MWNYVMPWYEPVLRGIAMFVLLFIASRILVRRPLSKMTSFDLGLMILTSLTIFAGIAGELYLLNFFPAMITVVSMISSYLLMNELVSRYSWLEKIIEGQPVVIILNGKIFKRVMRKQKVSESELFEAMRDHEIMNPEDVKCAIVEKDGNISVIKYEH